MLLRLLPGVVDEGSVDDDSDDDDGAVWRFVDSRLEVAVEVPLPELV